MASIRRRNGKWQVQVRRKGHRPVSSSFIRKEDAQKWALQTEVELQRSGLETGKEDLRKVTLKEILERYRDTITIRKLTKENETIAINAILRHNFVDQCLASVTVQTFADFRDIRLEEVKPSTLNRELTIISHVFSVARSEWGFPISNPISSLRRPRNSVPRNRRIDQPEIRELLSSASKCRNRHIRPTIEFAIYTGMRRAEILGSSWNHVDWQTNTLHIPRTKNGHPRTIPLTRDAMQILKSQRTLELERPFPLTVYALKQAWRRLLKRAGIKDLHFHDLRHEAISRFFEMGLSVPEVALISGHKDYRMLARYTHLRAEDVGRKMERLSKGELK